MIKKLLVTAMIVTSIGSLSSQSSSVRKKMQQRAIDATAFDMISTSHSSNNQLSRTSTIASYQDTLWYFYSKQKFRNLPANQLFYTIQSAVSTSTAGDLTEFGSSFLNNVSPNGTAVTVKGAYILASRQPNSNVAGIPIKLYLYNANPVGMPTTKVDSALATITNTNGVFNYVAFTVPKTVTGSFFISYRNIALASTDTLLAWLNAATTATSSYAASTKFGEGLAYTRVVVTPTLDALFSNTDFYGSTNGYDLETIVVPVVSFSVNANFTLTTAPNATATPGAFCAASSLNFSNTSTPAIMYNRQFNFNKFIPYWAPYSFTVQPNPADSITNWSFTTGPNIYTQNAVVNPGASSNFVTTLTNKYRPSPRQTSQRPSIADTKTSAGYTLVACGPVGINTVSGFENFNVYPNPAVSGKTNLTGLVGSNTILVYNALGQAVYNLATEKESVSLDLSSQPIGNYFVRITNSNHSTKTVKIINQ